MFERISKIKFIKDEIENIRCEVMNTIILNLMPVGVEGKTRRDQFIKVGGNPGNLLF